MSANINNIQKNIFGRLTEEAVAKKCQVHLSEDEFNILACSNCLTTLNYQNFSFVLLKYQEDVYVGIASFAECLLDGTDICDDFDCYEITAPFWLAIVYYGNLRVLDSVTKYQIMELIDPDANDDVINYQYEQLKQFFPYISLIKYNGVVEQSIIDYPELFIKKVALLFFLTQECTWNLPFDNNTVSAYKKFYNCIGLTHRAYPIDNIIRSLLSTEWRFCFLELYRCVERLYPIEQFSDILKLLENGFFITELIERFILSRSREINLLTDICQIVLSKSNASFDKLFVEPINKEKIASKAASTIYEVRNRIAHDQVIDFNFENESIANTYIIVLLDIIEIGYIHYQKKMEKIYPIGISSKKKYSIKELTVPNLVDVQK